MFVVDLVHLLAPARKHFFEILASIAASNHSRLIIIGLLERQALLPVLTEEMVAPTDVVNFPAFTSAAIYKRLTRMLAKYSHLIQENAGRVLKAMLSVFIKYQLDDQSSWHIIEGILRRVFGAAKERLAALKQDKSQKTVRNYKVNDEDVRLAFRMCFKVSPPAGRCSDQELIALCFLIK